MYLAYVLVTSALRLDNVCFTSWLRLLYMCLDAADLDPDAEPVVCNFFSSCKGGTSCCCDFKMYGLCLNWTCCINGYSACGRRRCELIEGSDLEADAELEVPAMSSITGNPVQQL